MSLESGNFLNDLVQANPASSDGKAEGDNHIRLVKKVLQNTFPNMTQALGKWNTKSANYLMLATDNKAIFRNSASINLTLTAAATLGNGWSVGIVAEGFDLTIIPQTGEEVNGEAGLVISDGTSCTLYCDGTKFYCDVVTFEQLVAPGGTLTGFLTLHADPTSALHAATKQYVDSILPVGVVLPFLGSVAPAGYYLVPTVSVQLLKATYPALYALVTTKFGAETATTFAGPAIPEGYTWAQATALLIGASTVGENLSHTHGGPGGGQVVALEAGGQLQRTLANPGEFRYGALQNSGGAANKAASVSSNFIVKV